MITIRNTKLFNDLLDIEPAGVPGYPGLDYITYWRGLFAITRGTLHGCKFENVEDKDSRVPHLCGGLDRVRITPRGFYFYDRGCNGKNNSFVIRKEL